MKINPVTKSNPDISHTNKKTDKSSEKKQIKGSSSIKEDIVTFSDELKDILKQKQEDIVKLQERIQNMTDGYINK